jgi:hypothetical protein
MVAGRLDDRKHKSGRAPGGRIDNFLTGLSEHDTVFQKEAAADWIRGLTLPSRARRSSESRT